MFSKECNDLLRAYLRTTQGNKIIEDCKKLLVKGNEPANSQDGIMMAMSMARKEGELDVIRWFIKLSEKEIKNGK